MDGNFGDNVDDIEESIWDWEHNHPLLNDVILSTLVRLLHHSDLPSFRMTCKTWKSFVESRFRQEFCIDLTGNTNNIVTRKTARFIYAMPQEIQESPFNWLKISEIRLGISSLDEIFFKNFVPCLKRLNITTKNTSIEYFQKVLNTLDSIEILELGLSDRITNHDGIFRQGGTTLMPKLPNLKELKWINIFEEESDIFFNENFLTEFYSGIDNLQLLNCPVEIWKHLGALNPKGIRNLRKLYLGNVNQIEVTNLIQLSNKGLALTELKCSHLGKDVQQESLNTFLQMQSVYLKVLKIGSSSSEREDFLRVDLPEVLENLEELSIKLCGKISYGIIDKKFPNLRELKVTCKEDNFCFLEDIFSNVRPINSMRKLELCIPMKSPRETLSDMGKLLPNVNSLTLGRPCKGTLQVLFEGRVWPELKELKIVSACPQIDDVLTGIRGTDVLNKDKMFDDGFLDGNISIRNLKKLQRLEINSNLTSKLHTLSCLPSDVSVYFAFMKMPELRQVFVHRSLISPEAAINLQGQMPSWTTCKIEPIKFEFDETIDAFQFHRNNQYLMKLLCRYPHGSLREFSGFLTSLWVEGRMGL